MSGIFISYRRDDTAGYAGRLYEALAAHFGKGFVFIDIDSIPAGQDFVGIVEQRIASCSVVLVLIGAQFLAQGAMEVLGVAFAEQRLGSGAGALGDDAGLGSGDPVP